MFSKENKFVLNKAFLIGCTLILVLVLLMPSAEGRESIAVLGFDGSGARAQHIAATNYLTGLLFDLDRFNLISRSEIDRILEEQDFQLSDLVDRETAVEAGNILGVDRAFVGSIDRLTASYSDGEYKGEARVTIRLIDIETGVIIQFFQSTGSARGSGYYEVRSRALEDCFDSGLTNQLREFFAITSFVLRAEPDRVDLFGGRQMGFREGQRYYILRVEDEGELSQRIAMVEIIQVSSSEARGELLWSSEDIREDDLVKEIPYSQQGVFEIRTTIRSYEFKDSSGQSQKGKMPVIAIGIGGEKAFSYGYGFLFSFGQSNDVNQFTMGLEGAYEFPIYQGRLHFLTNLGLGGVIASQAHQEYQLGNRNYPSGSASGAGFYTNLGANLRYYLNYDSGVRINLGLQGYLGSTISNWESSAEDEVNEYVNYPEVALSGLGVKLMLTIPFGS